VSLLWRVFAVNAAIVVAGAVALVATPATVSHPIADTEAVVVAAGIAALLVIDLVLLRRVLAPLRRLTAFVRSVEPLQPGARAQVGDADRDVRALTAALNEMLDRLEGERRASALRAVAAQEAERRRVARELHDEVGQALTAVVLTLKSAERSVPDDVARVLAEARDDVRAGLESVGAIATRLRPDVLDDLGLASALSEVAGDVERTAGVVVERRLDRELGELGEEVELVLYRVAQEALTNVARHAAAQRVLLELVRDGDAVVLRVRDDGRGLAGAAEGTGLRGMRERALLVGGRLEIHRATPRGTEVRLTVPVTAP